MQPALLRIGAKLGATGLAVGLIASAVIFSGTPEAPVKQAEADIFSLSFAPKTKRELFIDSLNENGLNTHRQYDYNGNTMSFAVAQTRKKPMDVLRMFQNDFARRGINKRAWTKDPVPLDKLVEGSNRFNDPKVPMADKQKVVDNALLHKERLDDFFTGGMVPTFTTPNHVIMSGGTLHHQPKDIIGVLKGVTKGRIKGRSLESNVKSMQFLEAFYDEESKMTTVTATWSEGEFDMERFNERKIVVPAEVAQRIPACPGCVRHKFFKANGKSGEMSHVMVGGGSLDDPIQFYDRVLSTRGWSRSPTADAVRTVQNLGHLSQGARLATYERGGEFITLIAYRGADNRVTTTIVETK